MFYFFAVEETAVVLQLKQQSSFFSKTKKKQKAKIIHKSKSSKSSMSLREERLRRLVRRKPVEDWNVDDVIEWLTLMTSNPEMKDFFRWRGVTVVFLSHYFFFLNIFLTHKQGEQLLVLDEHTLRTELEVDSSAEIKFVLRSVANLSKLVSFSLMLCSSFHTPTQLKQNKTKPN